MITKTKLFLLLAGLLAFCLNLAYGQTALTSTTLAEAVDETETSIDITSATGVAANDVAVVDKEAMRVVSVDTTNNRIVVIRGQYGTNADEHANGRLIYLDERDRFIQKDLTGTCTAASEYPAYTPLINLTNGKRFVCTNSKWAQVIFDELTFGDSEARDMGLYWDGNAQNFYFSLDDSADDMVLGTGGTIGTDPIVAFPNIGTTTSGQRAIFYGENPATAADNDESYLSFFTEDDVPSQTESARLSWRTLDVTAATNDAEFRFDTMIANTLTTVLQVGSSGAGGTTALMTMAGDVLVSGTTPQVTVGDAGAEDSAVVFDGNAQDFHIGLDDSADDLVFGLGSALGTTTAFAIDENQVTTFSQDPIIAGTTPRLTIGDAGAEDTQVNFDGNAVDFALGLDDSADDIVLAMGSALGTDNIASFPDVGTTTSGQRMALYGENPVTAADNDESYVSFFLEDSVPAQEEFARLSYIALDVTDATEDGQITIDADIAGTLTEVLAIGSSGAGGTTGLATITADIQLSGTTPTITVGDNGAEDSGINFDSSAAVDFNVSVDQSAAALVIGVGTAPGTTDAIRITTGPALAIVDATLSIGGIAYEFPPDDGDASEQLATNGTGTLTWEAAGSLREWKDPRGGTWENARWDPAMKQNALQAMLSINVYDFQFKNHGDPHGFSGDKMYSGIVADEAPWAIHKGTSLDPINTFGYTVAAIQALYDEIQTLKAEISRTKDSKIMIKECIPSSPGSRFEICETGPFVSVR